MTQLSRVAHLLIAGALLFAGKLGACGRSETENAAKNNVMSDGPMMVGGKQNRSVNTMI